MNIVSENNAEKSKVVSKCKKCKQKYKKKKREIVSEFKGWLCANENDLEKAKCKIYNIAFIAIRLH